MLPPDQEVICLKTDAFRELIHAVVKELKISRGLPLEDAWIAKPEAMRLLNISSKTTLQKFRNEGTVRFSKMASRNILYYRPSILEYIEKNAKETF